MLSLPSRNLRAAFLSKGGGSSTPLDRAAAISSIIALGEAGLGDFEGERALGGAELPVNRLP
jgi:hypothetical protein